MGSLFRPFGTVWRHSVLPNALTSTFCQRTTEQKFISTSFSNKNVLDTKPEQVDYSQILQKMGKKCSIFSRITCKLNFSSLTSLLYFIFIAVEKAKLADPSLKNPDYFQVHNLFTVKDLFEARVHLGHKKGGRNSKMNDFIFGTRFNVDIIDLDQTAFHLRQALNFTAHIAYRQGIILFITRSPSTMHLVEKTAIDCGEYAHCREWNIDVLTNSIVIQKSRFN